MSQKIKTSVEIDGSLSASQIANATTDTDKFLVSDGGTIKYRTGAELATDLGIAAGVTSKVQHQVKAGVAINKGQAVYVTGADGTNMIVGLASNATEATSSKTMGLLNATVSANGFADVITEGLLDGLDTSAAVAGNPVWLGTGGNLIYGLANKPYAPSHLVFIGIVTRVNANNGEIFVKVQNGFELDELHDVDLKTTAPINGHLLGFNGTLWVNKTIAGWLGYTPQAQLNGTGFVKASGTTITYDNTSYYPASNPNGYISTYTETDTLASVTGRGALTNTPITISAGTLNHVTLGDRFNLIGGSNFHITNNAYYDSGFKYKFADLAGKLALQADGILSYQTAAAGTIGAAITFDTKFSVDSSGNLLSTGSLQSPIFYDSNNTAYYVDPASTSNLNALNIGSAKLRWGGSTTPTLGLPFSGSANAFWIDVNDGDTGGLMVDNEGVTVYGAGDNGYVFRVIDEDVYQATTNVASSTTFQINQGQNGGGSIKGNFDISGTLSASGYNKTNWDTAFGWGNHASAGYVPQARTITINGTSYDLSANRSWTVTASETDTLATVTGRGATTSTRPSFDGGITVNGQSYVTANGYFVSGAQGFRWNDSSGSYNNVIMRDNGTTWFRNYLETPDSVRSPIYYDYNDTGYYWNPATDTSHRFQTPSGYIDIGPKNGSYCHIYTDRGSFYFNAQLEVLGNRVLNAGNYSNYAWSLEGSWKPASLASSTRLRGATSPDGGEFALAYSGGQIHPYADGFFYQNEGAYRVMDSNSIGDYTVGNYRTIADYSGDSTWYMRPNGRFVFANAHDWTQTFELLLPSGGSNNNTFAHFGQRQSNATNGNFRGVSIRRYVGGASDLGDLQAGNVYGRIFYDDDNTGYYFDGSGGTRQSRYLTISGGGTGNYGNELVVGNTSVQYSLQDTNLRPIIQATGAYPVLTLNHTVTSNGSHGATVQFTSNGVGNQFVIGSSGNGSRLDIGTASNSNWNPHNGIDNYQGTTGWRMDTSGNVYNLVSTRSPIYYDNNNTGYYVDPAGDSRVNTVYADRLATPYAQSPDNSHPGHGIRPFYSWNIGQANNSSAGYSNGISIGSNPGDQAYGFQIVQNMWDDQLYFRRYNGGWQGWRTALDNTNYGGYCNFGGNSVYGGIFYDGNDSSYYVNPNGTARLSYVVANAGIRIDGNENLYLDNNYGQSVIGVYSSYRYQGVFSMGNAYKLPIDGSGPGNLYGLTWSHPNAGGVAGNLNTHGLMALENGTWLASLTGSTRARDDMRAPIFYDNNNTSYYVDPAGSTSLSAVYANNWFRASGNTGLYGQDYGVHFYPQNSSAWSITGSGGNIELQFRSNHNSTIRGYVYADTSNNIGFLTSGGGWRLRCDDSGNAIATGDVTAYSDRRVKENIHTIDNALDKVSNLRGVYYTRIDSEDKQRKVGVIAQETLEVLPEVVGKDTDGMYNVAYGNITAVLIEAIKEQQTQIEELKQLVNKLINK